jgi:hypothetical protein
MDATGYEHDVVHANHSGAIIALETKLGTTDSNAATGAVLIGTGSGTSAWDTTPTLGGDLTMADNQIITAKMKDYSETVNVIGGTGGGTQDIDLTLGNVITATVDTSANTFTFSNPSASGSACSFTLILTNGGSQTVNWPGGVDWAGGSAPTLTTAGVDILTFTTVDAGTIWYGFAAGLDMK